MTEKISFSCKTWGAELNVVARSAISLFLWYQRGVNTFFWKYYHLMDFFFIFIVFQHWQDKINSFSKVCKNIMLLSQENNFWSPETSRFSRIRTNHCTNKSRVFNSKKKIKRYSTKQTLTSPSVVSWAHVNITRILFIWTLLEKRVNKRFRASVSSKTGEQELMFVGD